MEIKLVYPAWPKFRHKTAFLMPPLGPAVVAALTPPGYGLSIADDNAAPVVCAANADLVAISAMLVSQLPRAFALAEEYRRLGVPVVMGGQAAWALTNLCREHADAVVVGEAEGLWPRVVEDARRGRLKPLYRRRGFADPNTIPAARRDLYPADAYAYRGLRMMDLVETSRGCSLGCHHCQAPAFSGRRHRIRDVGAVIREMRGLGDGIFIVDNALEQSLSHQKALFRAMAGLGKYFVCHPISPEPEILELAARAGCWYVYHQIFSDSARIRRRIKLLHDFGIAVHGTVLLGLDSHGPDVFQRLLDFLLEVGLDLAEFTVLTPFPGTSLYREMKKAGRLLHEDWGRYNADEVVIQPARMTPDQLAEGHRFLWEGFYKEQSQTLRIFRLLRRIRSRLPETVV
jgi:radical SAM superfamily enzyme YgiQ (UPF0313 family)